MSCRIKSVIRLFEKEKIADLTAGILQDSVFKLDVGATTDRLFKAGLGACVLGGVAFTGHSCRLCRYFRAADHWSAVVGATLGALALPLFIGAVVVTTLSFLALGLIVGAYRDIMNTSLGDLNAGRGRYFYDVIHSSAYCHHLGFEEFKNLSLEDKLKQSKQVIPYDYMQ